VFVWKSIFILVFFNNVVMNLVSFSVYVNMGPFFLWFIVFLCVSLGFIVRVFLHRFSML
jgi:hypothetical protein